MRFYAASRKVNLLKNQSSNRRIAALHFRMFHLSKTRAIINNTEDIRFTSVSRSAYLSME